MRTVTDPRRLRLGLTGETGTWLLTAVLLLGGSLYPQPDAGFPARVASGLAALLPVVALASLLAGWLAVSAWSERAMALVSGRPLRAIVLASVVGTITPVCGLGVLPLIAALLRRGLPLAPVMAFWVSSPVMGPPMAVITVSILGPGFASAKAAAALFVGLLAGAVTALLPGFRGSGRAHIRPDRLDEPGCAPVGFWVEAWRSARLVLRWLVLALVLEILLQRLVPDAWIAAAFGAGNQASVTLAAIVGAPLYVDGYAALPLVRGLMDMGMSFGAALAFMVSGAAVSLYAAVAVAAIVRTRVFFLYLVLAVSGAIIAGYAADRLFP